MTRREWLLASLAFTAGCSRSGAPSLSSRLESKFANRIAFEAKQRAEHLSMLEGFRVPADATRTTPKPDIDLLASFPELKPLGKMTMRLHPRFGDEPKPQESKLGGQFLWPASESWPIDAEFELPLTPYLQLRIEDAPPQLAYRPGSDLLQLLVCPIPTDALPRIQLVWRRAADVGPDLMSVPESRIALPGLVPVPCLLFPERVIEYPDWNTLSKTALRPKIEAWKPEGIANLAGPQLYARQFSSAPGTKVGGYPRWGTDATPPACSTCKWGMDYLLTVAHEEWDADSRSRWQPIEEQSQIQTEGYRTACGLGRTILVFVCRRCEAWPVKAVTL